jgi:hypothetical protein
MVLLGLLVGGCAGFDDYYDEYPVYAPAPAYAPAPVRPACGAQLAPLPAQTAPPPLATTAGSAPAQSREPELR